ncbi:dockerin type I domain-containing protein [Merdimmobilis hominis]|uniref:dockerin type I domain-containing protein n=1 Tax=Merdimmobilis hominis TaxID=2897707 RepID=UPI0018989123|nr:dockerin type I domain-containing protein [Merdimmobilis hominis]
MKRKLKVIAAILLVLIMFISAMPMQLAAEAMTPLTTRYATPDGYNDHDYQKMVAFFEQTDENGVRNGEKLSENYDPTDPGTWWEADGSEIGVEWTVDDDEYRICEIRIGSSSLGMMGNLDVSGCTGLDRLDCSENQLTEINVSGCTALTDIDCSNNKLTELNVSTNTELYTLRCYGNQLTELDVSENTWLYELYCFGNELVRIDISGCTDLDGLDCSENQLTELDLSGNTSLRWLYCSGNRITELDLNANSELEALRCSENQLTAIDVSANTALTELHCSGNQLTELDLSENTSVYRLECEDNYITFLDLTNNRIDIDTVSAEGPGFIGVKTVIPGEYLVPAISAVPAPGSTFCGWYATDGTLVSTEAELVIDREECYYPYNFIARFTASTPGGIGDVDGDGVVRVSDAVLIMRCALGLIEFTPEQILCGDVDGDGVIKIADAVMVVRIALGLV